MFLLAFYSENLSAEKLESSKQQTSFYSSNCAIDTIVMNGIAPPSILTEDTTRFPNIYICTSVLTVYNLQVCGDEELKVKLKLEGKDTKYFTGKVVGGAFNKSGIIHFNPTDGARTYELKLTIISNYWTLHKRLICEVENRYAHNYFVSESSDKINSIAVPIRTKNQTFNIGFKTDLKSKNYFDFNKLKYIIKADNPMATRYVANSFKSSLKSWTWTVNTDKENEGVLEIVGMGERPKEEISQIKNQFKMHPFFSNKSNCTLSIDSEVENDCLIPSNSDLTVTYKRCLGENIFKINPNTYMLGNPSQNPVVSTVQIPISIAYPSHAKLIVYNAMGEEVKILIDKHMSGGAYEIDFLVDNIPSGIYFYRLTSGHFSQTKKLFISK